MFPFIQIFHLKIPMYGLCIASGIFFGSLLSFFLTKRENQNFYDFIVIATLTFAFAFVFAKLLYIFVSFPKSQFFKILLKTIISPKNFSGGFVFYGGLIGGIFGYIVGCKIVHLPLKNFVNIFAVAIPLIHAFGRIGCFCAGCCYGVGGFPVQLLESSLLFLLSAFLLILFLKKCQFVFLLYFFIYAVMRFFLEFLRADTERGFFLSLSTSQIISIAILIIVSIIAILHLLLRKF